MTLESLPAAGRNKNMTDIETLSKYFLYDLRNSIKFDIIYIPQVV
jgi:hypothetical protein